MNDMDLLASILDRETAESPMYVASAVGDINDENKSNKKQKLDTGGDGNGQNRINLAGTDASNIVGTDTGTAGASARPDASETRNALGAKVNAVTEVTGANVPAAATGIKTLNNGERGAAVVKMDVDMETSAQAANSQISEETTTKTPKIVHPRTTTELVVKEILASPEYQQILEAKERERLSSQPVVRQVVHRPPIPGLGASAQKAPDTTASKPKVSETTAAVLPSISDPEPKTKLSSTSKSGSAPVSTSQSQAMSTATTTATVPTPIPTGRARTSEYINRLYHLCATEGLDIPVFDFDTVTFAPVSLFKAKLTVAGLIVGSDGVESASPIGGKKGGGVDLGATTAAASTAGAADDETEPAKAGEKGAYKSKKEAKEAAAEYGYLALTRFINEGIIGRKAGSQAGSEGGQKQQEGPKENWVGLLQGKVMFSDYHYICFVQAYSIRYLCKHLRVSPFYVKTGSMLT